MLTTGLESLIGKGLAQYKTFTFGAGGVGRIPVPKASFIVIIDFDYFHFVDKPDTVTEATPATAYFSFQTEEDNTDVTWSLNGEPPVPSIIDYDILNPLQTQVDFQTYLNANFPGFSVSIALLTLTNVVNVTGVTVPFIPGQWDYTATGDDLSTYQGGIDTNTLVWDGVMLTPVVNQWVWLGTMTSNGDGTYNLFADLLDGITAEVIGSITGTFNSNNNTMTFVITEITGYEWQTTVTTSTPGQQYNGQSPTITYDPLPTSSSENAFINGSAGTTSIANVLKKSAHQLEFRSRKSRNHYVIREDIEIFNRTPFTGLENDFTYNVRGYYHRDTYLVHTESVQVNIINISVPESWAVNYGASSSKSQEENLPVGYGQVGIVNLPTVQEATLNGVNERYKPLTPEFTDPLGGAAQEQFKFNTEAGRELQNPSIPLIDGYSNGRNYPIVNIGYVLINQDYNDFVKPS